MKNILVVGFPETIEEFKLLQINNARLDFINQMDVEAYHSVGGNELEEEELGFMVGEGEDSMPDILGEEVLSQYEVVFDLDLDDNPSNLADYAQHSHLIVFGRSVKRSLAELAYEYAGELECTLFGINSLPTFINRPVVEVSLLNEEDKLKLANLAKELELETEVVADGVGMVTPRVIFLIINEACFLLGEGTAGIEDVDRAMKLGTNYPKGPFEWADAIGVRHVYETLEKLRQETGEGKYRVAPVLRRKFLKGESFLN